MALSNRLFSEAFRDMQRAFSIFDQPGIFDMARRPSMALNSDWDSFVRYPATDMVETPQSFELQAEVPGYEKKDIQIELADSRTLVLHGSVEQTPSTNSQKDQASGVTQTNENIVSKEVTPPQWWTNERSVRSFHRSISFPVPVQSDKIKASYENGILKIIVPKANEEARKTIQID